MNPPRPRSHAFHGPHAHGVPHEQAVALERRQMLDEQQRAFRGMHAPVPPRDARRRPPA